MKFNMVFYSLIHHNASIIDDSNHVVSNKEAIYKLDKCSSHFPIDFLCLSFLLFSIIPSNITVAINTSRNLLIHRNYCRRSFNSSREIRISLHLLGDRVFFCIYRGFGSYLKWFGRFRRPRTSPGRKIDIFLPLNLKVTRNSTTEIIETFDSMALFFFFRFFHTLL